jgi:HTH-type transcriptional regulator / antitoxin HigA
MMIAPEEARNVPRVLAECGVRYVVVEPLKSAKIDGVCCWLDQSSPVIGMSLRLDRIDNFWFVLRHEIEHVLQRHGIKDPVIDAELEGERASDSGPIEQERVANAAASDFCVPKQEMASFIARKDPFFSEKDIIGFARRMNVHPGIVVGQIQAHTKRWDFLRPHLVRIRQFLLSGAMVDGWGQVAPVTL